MAAAAPLHADRGHGRANVANRDRGRDYSRRAHPSDTPGRITDGHLSPKPIPTILSDATLCQAAHHHLAKLKLVEPLAGLFNPTAPGGLTSKGHLEIMWLVQEVQ